MKLRILFMGTPEFAVPSLRVLAQESKKNSSYFELIAVFTQPDREGGRGLEKKPTPVKQEAQKFGIRVEQPEKLTQSFQILKELQPDLIVVAAYGQLLKQEVLDLPRLGCINIHSSLLPRWRGAAPIHWAILEGDKETGISIQKMVLKLDAGPILGEVRTPILPTDTLPQLHDRLADLAPSLLLTVIEKLRNGSVEERIQNEAEVTYASKLSKKMENLDPLHKTAIELERQCRALIPWPGVSLRYISRDSSPGKKVRLKVHSAKIFQHQVVPKVEAGFLVARGSALILGTAQGALELLKVQLEGKRVVTGSEFLNGHTTHGELFEVQVVSESE